jgi:hypothetical protein
MAHIFRKIRKFRDAYPQYWSLVCFYKRLRRIVEDGERLKKKRSELGDVAFERRVGLLAQRLDAVLAWRNPNAVLKAVIEKVARQKDYILTFVRFEGVPKHNNFGEYIIKRGILKRKVSGGSTSAEGAMAYARIQSVAMTCQLRGLSFRDYLLQCLTHYLKTGNVLLLACAVQRRRFSSGCKSHPATAPAGSNRSNYGGNEMVEAFGEACHEIR